MKAVIYETTGAAREVLRIEEIPTPEPGPGEVRVKLAYSGVNPSDVKSRVGVALEDPAVPADRAAQRRRRLDRRGGRRGSWLPGSASGFSSGTRPGAGLSAPPRNT